VCSHLLCDLDGTLVDSSSGILNTLRTCLASLGKRSKVDLTHQLIGPPLRTMIQAATGSSDVDSTTEIETAFRVEYDLRGYLATRAYPGIREALTEMQAHGVRLHLVTNKRLVPTLKILEMFGWSHAFSTVSTLDARPAATSKTEVVAELLAQLKVPGSSVALVGDSVDDALAASENRIFFVHATWGYGLGARLGEFGQSVADAQQMMQLVLRGHSALVAHGK
jgi:phosphoglycolate phosphatase